MKSRIEMLDVLGRAIEQASKLSKQLGLEHLPILLEMAKLEFLNEVGADLEMQKAGGSRGISSSRRVAH